MAKTITFPSELQCNPEPFLVLTGLDITYNAVHKSIWDAFSNNRHPDRLQVKFACLAGDHAFPRCKSKRSSYDWYIPKGLLKTKWMTKHLNEIPALVVVFFELDWDELAWRERHLACASRVQVVRSSLQGRTTKVAVVLIQKSTPLPPGEDMVAAERAAALCSACDLSSKSLFVLPHSDHLLGYIVRLESAFVELAHTYYHSELRRVKAHKEFLNKTTHQLLFPRHQFKIAFFSEFMQDSTNALKHYQQSYNHIHELRTNATNNLEVKVVGGFVNYKICRIFFLQLNAPLDAINQFQRHIELFKLQFGNSELMFEHCAWLSQQYLLFGDLFNKAIDQGLAAIQTQHPGFYYQQASYYATLRKKHAQSLQGISNVSYPMPDPLEAQCLDFFGQRPWRQGHQRIDPPDIVLENNGILALKKKELEIDHSWIIIPLINSAVTQFKKYHCPRLKRYLTIQMGIEYFHAEDYRKAIALLCRSIPQYRDCQWCLILTQLISLVFECSYMLGDVQNYVTSALELIGGLSQLCDDEKKEIQDNVLQVLHGKAPKFIPLSSRILCKNANKVSSKPQKAWKATEKPASSTLYVEMSNLLACVECKVIFCSSEVSIDSCVKIEVYTRVTSIKPMQFTALSVYFNNLGYNSACVISDSPGHGTLYYTPNEVKRHVFEFPVDHDDLHKCIQVKNVKLFLGCEHDGYCLELNWLKTSENYEHAKPDNVNEGSQQNWINVSERRSVQIVERKSRLYLKVINQPPALTNEVLAIRLSICSDEDLAENVNILVTLKAEDHVESFFQSASISKSEEQLTQHSKTVEMQFDALKLNETKEVVIYFQSTAAGAATLALQSCYTVSNLPVLSTLVVGKELKQISCPSKSTTNICFDVVDPFNFTAHLTSLNMESVSSIYFGQPFMVLASLTAHSSWPIEVLSCHHVLPDNPSFTVVSQFDDSQCILSTEGESVVKCSALSASPPIAKQVDMTELGFYKVKWKRHGSTNVATETSLKMPVITLKLFPVSISANFPAFGILRQVLKVKFCITNTSKEFKIIEISFESVEAFMFSGPKQTKMFLSPSDSNSIECIFIPLALGYQALPKMLVRGFYKHTNGTSELLQRENLDNFMSHSSIPTDIYIKPKIL